MDELAQIAEDKIIFFQNNGYMSIDRLVYDLELEHLRRVYDGIINGLASGQPEMTYADVMVSSGLIWIHTPELSHQELLENPLYERAKVLASKLLGVSPSQITASFRIFYKPALIGRQVPWHQDEAYRDPAYDWNALNVWIPLDDASLENGCMQFIPGSHKQEVHFHRQISFDPTAGLGLTTENVEPRQAVSCPVPAGGATFHQCRTLHYSGPNATGSSRRALTLVCDAPSTPRETPHERPWQTWTNRSWFQS